MSQLRIRPARLPEEMRTLSRLCHGYREQLLQLGPEVERILDTFYPLETYDELITELPQKHARPRGSILLVEKDDHVIGCGMIQPLGEDDAEVKRVYIEPKAQGSGAGKLLSQALVDQACADGYKRILLDTTKVSEAARRLYESLGFKQRGPYSDISDDVLGTMVFYELKL